MIEIFAKSSLRLLALSYFAKSYIIDVSQDPKYSFLVLFGNLLNFEFKQRYLLRVLFPYLQFCHFYCSLPWEFLIFSHGLIHSPLLKNCIALKES